MRPPEFDIDMYPPFEGFPKEGIEFFKHLKRHNNREWFEAHREDYDSVMEVFGSFVGRLIAEKGKVKVLLNIIGRTTPVELDFMQIEKM